MTMKSISNKTDSRCSYQDVFPHMDKAHRKAADILSSRRPINEHLRGANIHKINVVG